MAQGAELDKVYVYHPPKDEEQKDRYQQVRTAARELAETVLRHCPPSREQSLALTKIEEAMMWANAGIARE